MLFNSIEFALFLPLVFVLYWTLFSRSIRLRNLFIVVVSYIFYGWWDWRFLLLIAFTSLCSFASGILIENRPRHARIISTANILLNLGILGTFKYYDFFVSSFAELFAVDCDSLLLKIVLPVGISFYTFQALSYSIDVYRRQLTATRDIVAFFAYISFFPQLVAGPIERATQLLPQFHRRHTFDYGQCVDGVRQILWGLFKKMVVADNCAIMANYVFENYTHESGAMLLIGAVAFTFQIYGDFSGYSDIALGTARLFGFRLMRNFNLPYFSRDIAEFWRRWHISLNTWFRDYLYIPLGGSHGSKAMIVRNTFIIFLVSGLWHGANWTFILWGGYNALLFMPLILSHRNRKYLDHIAPGRRLPSWSEAGHMVVTFLLVMFGWIIFRAETIADAWGYIARIFSPAAALPLKWPDSWFETSFINALVGIVILTLTEWFTRKKQHPMENFGASGHGLFRLRAMRYAAYYLIMALLYVMFAQQQTFIYFQF